MQQQIINSENLRIAQRLRAGIRGDVWFPEGRHNKRFIYRAIVATKEAMTRAAEILERAGAPPPTFILQIDWQLLREQKEYCVNEAANNTECAHLYDGIVHLMDAIQDYAIYIGMDGIFVFGDEPSHVSA